MLLILVSFLAKWGWRSERQTTELGGKDWLLDNSSQLLNHFQILKDDKLTIHDLLEGDIWRGQPYCARERETRPEPAAMVSTLCHLWWNCSDGDDKGVDVGCDNEGAFEDDCDIPGTLTALSLTGLRWRRQRGDMRRLRIISLPRRNEIGWKLTTFTFLLGGALGLKQHGHAGLAEQARHWEPCPWGLQDHRLLCHNHALSEGGRRNATSLFRVVLTRNIIPSLEKTWKWTTFPQDYSLRQPP